MNTIKELRTTTKMSQSKFATYLGIPVANIQHWEQGVASPPTYLVSLITRVMKNDGFINDDLSVIQKDAIRQARATLAVEDMQFPDQYIPDIKSLVSGKISREEYQASIVSF
ncbi:MAG: helix-turn-helix domain-containing protein [Eubacterium sp.]|nr:helix-turn-helix domain-containing protein [Eubacterium sp.]